MLKYKHFEVQDDGPVIVVHLNDPKLADTLLVTELEVELLAYVEQYRPKKMLVNFGVVTHCSTSVINGLIRAKKRVVQGGGELKLCCLSPAIREAYKLLNLDGTVFQIYESTADALRSFA